jgi:hypothetical protein
MPCISEIVMPKPPDSKAAGPHMACTYWASCLPMFAPPVCCCWSWRPLHPGTPSPPPQQQPDHPGSDPTEGCPACMGTDTKESCKSQVGVKGPSRGRGRQQHNSHACHQVTPDQQLASAPAAACQQAVCLDAACCSSNGVAELTADSARYMPTLAT